MDDWTPPSGYTKNADGTVTAADGQVFTPVKDSDGNIRTNSNGDPIFNTQSGGTTAQTTLTNPSTSGSPIAAPAVSISQSDLVFINNIPPGSSGTVVVNGQSTLITKGTDGRIVDATPVNNLPSVAEVPGPLPPDPPSDPWWSKAIKQLEGMMDDL